MAVPGLQYPKPPRSPTLGGAATNDPYGLARRVGAGPSPVAAAAAAGPPKPPGPSPNATLHPGLAAMLNPTAKTAVGSPGYVSPYDLNTDPGLQAAQSLAGLSDEQAKSAATKQQTNLLLGYGDAGLINAVLHDPTLAAAAANNPNSTLKQLAKQHTQGLKTLGDNLNAANLSYSGYRVTQEQQAENDYQSQLAQAASAVNSGLDTISGSLAQALAADNASRISAINDAATRAAQYAASSGVDPGAPGPASAAAKKTSGTPAAKAVLPAAAYAKKYAPAPAPKKPAAAKPLPKRLGPD